MAYNLSPGTLVVPDLSKYSGRELKSFGFVLGEIIEDGALHHGDACYVVNILQTTTSIIRLKRFDDGNFLVMKERVKPIE